MNSRNCTLMMMTLQCAGELTLPRLRIWYVNAKQSSLAKFLSKLFKLIDNMQRNWNWVQLTCQSIIELDLSGNRIFKLSTQNPCSNFKTLFAHNTHNIYIYVWYYSCKIQVSNRDGSRRMTVGRPESSPAIILKIGQTGAQQTTDWGRKNVLACNMFAAHRK